MARFLTTASALRVLGYPGSACLRRCLCEELPCPLLTWLVTELRTTCPEVQDDAGRDSRVNTILVGELRDVLTKLHCPYLSLTTETLNSVLLNELIEFLVTELLAARILQYKDVHPEDIMKLDETPKERREEWDGELETEEADLEAEREQKEFKNEFAELLKALELPDSSQLSDACSQVESRLVILPGGALPGPLLKTSLSYEQWSSIQKISQALIQDYEYRMQMVIKRFEVTKQSFTWGERGEDRRKAISTIALPSPPSAQSHVSLSSLLAAREDQSRILPVKAGHSTAIHKVMMGNVPDRGGRPGEIGPPMPVWEGRREGGGQGRQRRWTRKNKKK